MDPVLATLVFLFTLFRLWSRVTDTPMSTAATDCAVAAFASTFSTSCERQPTTPTTLRRRKISKNLPVELLLIVFKLVDQLERRSRAEWNKKETRCFMSPSLFPYSIASVCSLWRDTISLVPEFWRCVVILIGTPATPLSAIVSQLEWSRDHDLEVIVTQRDVNSTVNDPHERSNMISIMNILGSHMHRIQHLHFDVKFSSSLPCFSTDFYGTATILRKLHLECREDDGGPDPIALRGREEFECPRLMFLAIDGRNYYEACRRDVRWTSKITTICSLRIFHFSPRPSESFSTYELMNPLIDMVNLGQIFVTDLVLRPSSNHLHLMQSFSPLFFEDVHSVRVINDICTSIGDSEYLVFTRCTFGDTERLGESFNREGCLTLVEINQDLSPILRHWKGALLRIENCSYFDDIVLDMMTPIENRASVCAPHVQELKIYGCQNYSVAALRRSVESRLHPPGHLSPPPSRIRYLSIWGNEPLLSKRDRAWFYANVQTFYYCDKRD